MDFDGKLLRSVYAKPSLWDTQLLSSKNNAFVSELWHKVACDTGISPATCQARWVELKNCFIAESIKLKDPNVRLNNQWPLFNSMQFLKYEPTVAMLVSTGIEAKSNEIPKKRICLNDSSDCDVLFFESLLPFMEKVPFGPEKLRLRCKIQNVVLEELQLQSPNNCVEDPLDLNCLKNDDSKA